MTDAPVTLTYTNWRGVTAERTILPLRVWFGATDWHPEPQWLLTAIDVEKGVERDFALKGIAPATQPQTPTDEPAARSAWQPMETAPKDGTPILLEVPDAEHGWVIAFWSDPSIGDTSAEDAGWYESEASSYRADFMYGAPTGWQPLPEPAKGDA